MINKKILKILILALLVFPFFSFANEEEVHKVFKVEVVEIVDETEETDFIKNVPIKIQNLKVKDLKTGESIDVYNDFRTVSVGQKIFYSVNDFGEGNYQNILVGVSRLNQIILLTILFIIVVVVFSGAKGVRSVFSLALSFLAIFYIMLPLILKGVNPLIVGPGIAFIVLFFAIFFSYGFNKVSKIAFLGTAVTVVITSLLAFLSIKFFALSGITDETSVYLSYFSDTPINLVNLLTAGIIIGVLGVLDDIAVTQVAVVRELYLSNKNLSKEEVYKRAIRVGQDHVSALVNTLVLAYVGVALPLILILKLSNGSLDSTLSQEVVASEILRTIVGSIGVILAVPITTYLAVRFLSRDIEKLSSIKFDGGHSHGHDDHSGHSH
ncbi:MAG: hypothetical protein QG654_390 [Patescibacteria group bacterium]|nr:hypothetical protein [Patescibacteria group bacterium]